jgi:hypothetical protein
MGARQSVAFFAQFSMSCMDQSHPVPHILLYSDIIANVLVYFSFLSLSLLSVPLPFTIAVQFVRVSQFPSVLCRRDSAPLQHPSYWTRLAYIDACQVALGILSNKLFTQLFAAELFSLAEDPVANVRIRLARLMPSIARACGTKIAFGTAMDMLLADKTDADVMAEAASAKKAVATVKVTPESSAAALEDEQRESAEKVFFVQRQKRKQSSNSPAANGAASPSTGAIFAPSPVDIVSPESGATIASPKKKASRRISAGSASSTAEASQVRLSANGRPSAPKLTIVRGSSTSSSSPGFGLTQPARPSTPISQPDSPGSTPSLLRVLTPAPIARTSEPAKYAASVDPGLGSDVGATTSCTVARGASDTTGEEGIPRIAQRGITRHGGNPRQGASSIVSSASSLTPSQADEVLMMPSSADSGPGVGTRLTATNRRQTPIGSGDGVRDKPLPARAPRKKLFSCFG